MVKWGSLFHLGSAAHAARAARAARPLRRRPLLLLLLLLLLGAVHLERPRRRLREPLERAVRESR
jgi:hypothetical protein